MGTNISLAEPETPRAPPAPAEPEAKASPSPKEVSTPESGGFKPLSRAVTFDHRKHSPTRPRNKGGHGEAPIVRDPTIPEGVGLSRRAWTDVMDPKFLRRRGHGYHAEDHERFMNDAAEAVLYRRHFNFTPMKRNPSLKGVIDFVQLTRRQTGESLTASEGDAHPGTVVVVDPFSTGVIVAAEALNQGFHLVYAISGELDELMDMIPAEYRSVTENVKTVKVDDSLPLEDQLDRLIKELREAAEGRDLVAVVAGAETGVEAADALAEALALPTANGTALSEARRNKYVMGETVRAAGLRAVEQAYATTWPEVAGFLESFEASFRSAADGIVVKPMNSAGSDDVLLCHSVDEVKDAYGSIMGKRNQLGLVNDGVLVQEFLTGVEYVVDSVSLDGEHKCVALWEYDRRPANGGAFVNFGQHLIAGDEPNPLKKSDADPDTIGEMLVAYTHSVIDALGIRYGPTHAEVKVTPHGPCLVEVGARCHGGEGLWVRICDDVWGYNQAQLTLDVFVGNRERWNNVPRMPLSEKRRNFGILKFLITYEDGVFKEASANALEQVRGLSSYVDVELFKKPGDRIKPTQNCFGWCGAVKLVNPSEEQINADNALINELEKPGGLYVLEQGAAPKKGRIAIVDPFSTGAVVAQHVCKLGYDCISIYSGKLSDMAFLESFIPAGLEVSFSAVIAQPEDAVSTAAMCANTVTELGKLGLTDGLLAILPGAETGVELADALSEELGLLTNGTELSDARRNKYVMGETVRKAGLRAVAQVRAKEFWEVEAFLAANGMGPDGGDGGVPKGVWWPLVNKPLDSAGTDNVTLNQSVEELRTSFEQVVGQMNGLGKRNEGCLIQEFLDGEEYVVDSVTVEGRHKTVAVWRYDRGAMNGAPFVCRGQELLIMGEKDLEGNDLVAELCRYTHGVLDALKVVYGPSHAEVKICRGEPVLVEVGTRCHGAEGVWIEACQRCLGYDQSFLALDAYLGAEELQKVPDIPDRRQSYGCVKFLSVHEAQVGALAAPVLKSMGEEAMVEVRNMPSFVGFEAFKKPGDPLLPTQDCFTWAGVIKLVHEDEAQMQRDYDRILELEKDGLYVVEDGAAAEEASGTA